MNTINTETIYRQEGGMNEKHNIDTEIEFKIEIIEVTINSWVEYRFMLTINKDNNRNLGIEIKLTHSRKR